jgi:hypothetical protein
LCFVGVFYCRVFSCAASTVMVVLIFYSSWCLLRQNRFTRLSLETTLSSNIHVPSAFRNRSHPSKNWSSSIRISRFWITYSDHQGATLDRHIETVVLLGKILPKPINKTWLFNFPVIKFTSNTASLVAAEIISNLSLFFFFSAFSYQKDQSHS